MHSTVDKLYLNERTFLQKFYASLKYVWNRAGQSVYFGGRGACCGRRFWMYDVIKSW